MEVPLFFQYGASHKPPWAELPRLARRKPFLMLVNTIHEFILNFNQADFDGSPAFAIPQIRRLI
jgi:hypothetical protein